ncbi:MULTISPECIES: DUF2231 domain-containing protein [unclassified Plantactinospora]|uniref:DUF2231 domain-containing protein n=1 Tax=unclassified Plantactinospora TaxID=2631981 RepID=UPI000D16C0A6|nr:MULTISPECIES: DUF2231 domain-containing protein [unclassified Plantactinospora]AVT34592.1 hypothetical protein C6361_19250 [Plantactinospora sp. BC1]AVT39808.1 hypothetical protein C6W10_28935 [Plantactinospora sp. BB1]
MESRVKVLGHPVHPMLVMFPIALFVSATIFDVIDVAGGPAFLGELAYWNILVGLIGGVLAAMAGAVDLLAVPAGTRAKRVGVAHASTNIAVLLLFAAVWAVRLAADTRAAGGALVAIEVVAVAGAGLGAWFGGELVDRLGVGVDPDADLNASSSLRPRTTAAAAADRPKER